MIYNTPKDMELSRSALKRLKMQPTGIQSADKLNKPQKASPSTALPSFGTAESPRTRVVQPEKPKASQEKPEALTKTAKSSPSNVPAPKAVTQAPKKAPSAPPVVHSTNSAAVKGGKKPRKAKPAEKPAKRNTAHFTKAAAFFVLLYFGTAVAFILPLRPSYSASEKRNLAVFPKFTLEAFASGKYFDDIGLWFSDTFPFREKLTQLDGDIKAAYGFGTVKIHGDIDSGDEIPDTPLEAVVTTDEATTSPETTLPATEAPTKEQTTEKVTKPNVKVQTLGAILVAGNAGYEYFNYSSALAPKFVNLVSNIKSTAGNKSEVYTILPPTSTDVTLNDAIRADINSSDQKKAIDYFNASFKNVKPVTGVFDSLRNHRDEYIYFRTDHHWTALGAYYAYEQFASVKGITPDSLSSFKTTTFKDFLGTFYANSGQSKALGKTPDSITAYLPKNNVDFSFKQTDGTVLKWDVIYDVSDYSSANKYSTFVAGDQPYEIIKNLDKTDGETCLVIKDSYANAFIPFLISHYKTIYVIDPRHYTGTLSAFTGSHKISDIIFVANISTTRNDVYINALSNFIR